MKLGDRVEHATFGLGTLVEVNDLHTVVHFDDHGRKKFSTQMVTLAPASASTTASVASPPSRPDGAPATIDQLIDLARRKVGSEDSLKEFVSSMRRALAGPDHPHVGVLSGMRVQQFQNWLLDENPRWQLTDAQLLAVMRVEFPLASGLVHIGDVDTGLKQIVGIRNHYNRDGHNGPSPTSRGMPLSISYGRF